MKQITVFGREPALVIGFIAAVVAVLAGMNLPWLSAGAAVAITAAIAAIITAWATRPVAPALYVGTVVAVAAVLAQYQVHVSDVLISAIGGLVLAAFALFGVRPQVTPAGDPAPISPSQGAIR